MNEDLVKLGGGSPEEVASLAVMSAGYRNFRHLALEIIQNKWHKLPKQELCERINIQPEVWDELITLDSFLQEMSWAVVYQYAGRPDVLVPIIERLTDIILHSENEENSLAAERIHGSLMTRMGIFPRNELREGHAGIQINILNNHAPQEAVVVIDDEAEQRKLANGLRNRPVIPFATAEAVYTTLEGDYAYARGDGSTGLETSDGDSGPSTVRPTP